MIFAVAVGSVLRRVLGALVLVGVLADASACIVAYARVDTSPTELAISALCPCGCKAHTGALAGVGLTQLAASPAETVLPDAPRVAPERAAPPSPPRAPVEAIDHVPILLA